MTESRPPEWYPAAPTAPPAPPLVSPETAKRRNTNKKIFKVFGAVFAALIVLVVATNALSKKSNKAINPSNATIAATSAAATDAPVPSATTSASTDTAIPDGLQIYSWYETPGVGDLITKMGTDMASVGTAGGNQDVTGITAACTSLKADVVKFETAPAAPVPALRTYMARAMDNYSTGATECINGDYAHSAPTLEAGTADLQKAITVIGSAK